jgi:hypothetical protein
LSAPESATASHQHYRRSLGTLGLAFYYSGVRSSWPNPSLAQVRAELTSSDAAVEPETVSV